MTDRLEGMKVAHEDEKQDYERQLADLRAEYTKTKDELDGEIMASYFWFLKNVFLGLRFDLFSARY